ncbi:MAG: hypothetical protein NT154_12665, partial [Verrucomicrobia bacterium]|nr:hypothetical protein [Verrucomicrobiota bacterium]
MNTPSAEHSRALDKACPALHGPRRAGCARPMPDTTNDANGRSTGQPAHGTGPPWGTPPPPPSTQQDFHPHPS